MSSNQVQLLKVGGAMLQDVKYLQQLSQHIQAIVKARKRVVLVHGGGKEIASLHDKLNIPHRKELGLRVTSEASMDLVTKVLCGLVNKRLVANLNAAGIKALGICGADQGVMHAEFLNQDQLGRVGGPPNVDVNVIEALLSTTQVLVVSPVCLGPDGALLNVNADLVAQAVAVALNTDCLDFVTDVEGVRTANGMARSLVPDQIEEMIQDSIVEGGMIPKLQASIAALVGGVPKVRVGSLESLSRGLATEVAA